MIQNKNILISGGAGSIGRILIHRLLERDPNVVRVFDQSEPGLAALRTEINDDRLRFLAGNIRDKDRLRRALDGIDIVVHSAALKHVDICEYNPFEAVKTNVIGLQNVIDTAIDASVERFVFTSSDKAVHPANTMGTTKLLGEKLVTAANKYSGGHDIRLTSVRFGNVVNSSQSVIPLFIDQIERGGPVELTDPRMTRFFLTYDDVADLIVEAVNQTQGGEVFIRKMEAIRIEDLAHAMIEVFAPIYGHESDLINVVETGSRLGETINEEIMTEREVSRTVENESMYAIIPEQSDENGYISHQGLPGFVDVDGVVRSSKNAEVLAREQIIQILHSEFREELTG